MGEMSSTDLAWVFPGQGSQSVGMGRALAEADAEAHAVFQAADEALGRSLSQVIFEGPAQTLEQTDTQQPAIVATSIALLGALRRRGLLDAPGVIAGHSLGQYSAYVAAGVLELPDALRLVAERGRLMQVHGRGAMAAVLDLDPAVLAEIATEASVEVANVNAPGQVTLSGRRDGIEHAMTLARERGARRVVALPVSAAFHSSLMRPVVDAMRPLVEAAPMREPVAPIISNVDAQPLTIVAELRRELLDHICAPVQWVATIETMRARGATRFVEIGPGRVLSGLIRRIVRGAAIADADTLLG